MSNQNSWHGQGNLVANAELVGENKDVARFSLAVNNGFGKFASTTFVDCVAFGKQAEVAFKHFTKGKQIIVNGALMLNRWEKDGKNFQKLEIHLDRINGFNFVAGGKNNDAPAEAESGAEVAGTDPVAATADTGEDAGGDLF